MDYISHLNFVRTNLERIEDPQWTHHDIFFRLFPLSGDALVLIIAIHLRFALILRRLVILLSPPDENTINFYRKN